MKISVYYTAPVERLAKLPCGDWIDLRCAKDMTIKKGESALIPLGVVIKLPEGCEAHILPRSSTFKNFGIIQTNGMGIVDESYCGEKDEWRMPVYALRDTELHLNDRICQFRVVKKMPPVEFEELTEVSSPSRGGFGSTGKS
ncbi:MAG: deoxyuridine 5'-triphosphate nucleotidohydrolase [Eubacteriales bacterium]|nr:deoxyuridine 5'-triphosphate nucleotidohydrolase [Eubacteriales bacterium]MDD3880836.1 deoxyuridine 5'-triphosphate nucleotidohydrolase [Eubacteriales bacterium]MDD4511797.1 deoxyuridine 5'-triphosphate nucleotidohydrolase [Eubacteriales bacterium]